MGLETSPDIVARGIAHPAAPHIRLVSMGALGPFSWRWPDADEAYERGWAAIAEVDGHDYHVRHGVCRRVAFGRTRIRSVTWVEGQPTVEGVEADDFSRSECLLSLIKVAKRHLRPGDAVPAGYEAFPVVVVADEAAGPYSPRSLALKLRQDDIAGSTRHALLRAAAWGRLRPGPSPQAGSTGQRCGRGSSVGVRSVSHSPAPYRQRSCTPAATSATVLSPNSTSTGRRYWNSSRHTGTSASRSPHRSWSQVTPRCAISTVLS